MRTRHLAVGLSLLAVVPLLIVACGDDSSTTGDDGGAGDASTDGSVAQEDGSLGDGGSGDGGAGDGQANDTGVDAAPCFVDAAGPYLVDAIEVAAEGEGACALRQDHTVVCWGANVSGQLGTGAPDAASGFSTTPVPVAFPSDAGTVRIDHVAGGYDHICAVDGTKRVWCWGSNVNGELGNGLTGVTASPQPTLVLDAQGQPIHAEALAAGYHATCALASDGSVSCWGSIANFADGGADASAGAPFAIPIGVTMSGADRQIEAHAYTTHFCAKDSARVVCWGLGPQEVALTSLASGDINLGVGDQLADGGALLPLVRVETGGHHSCAVDGRHDLYCWGQNIRGELGDAGTTARPTRMTSVPDGSVATVSNGDAVTCYLDGAGKAHCFGFGGTGALGNGDDSGVDRPAPQLVVDVDAGGALGPVGSLSAGTFFGCARVPNGCGPNGPSQVFCWGAGYGGVQTATPVRISSP